MPANGALPGAMLVLVLLAASFPQPAGAGLILNEILVNPERDWDGDGGLSFKGDEWIEVLNMGPEVEDLSGYYLRDIFGTDPHLELCGLLRPGEVAVFFGSDAMAWQTTHGFSDYGFALNNTGDTVELLRELGQPGDYQFELHDSMTILAHEAETDRSAGWAQEGGGWVLFDALNLYQGNLAPGSSGCLPTPGDLNFCIPLVPIDSGTWDSLKSYYR